MKEKFGEDFKKKKVVMSWAYSERFKPAGVPQAILAAAGLLGMNLTWLIPRDMTCIRSTWTTLTK